MLYGAFGKTCLTWWLWREFTETKGPSKKPLFLKTLCKESLVILKWMQSRFKWSQQVMEWKWIGSADWQGDNTTDLLEGKTKQTQNHPAVGKFLTEKPWTSILSYKIQTMM